MTELASLFRRSDALTLYSEHRRVSGLPSAIVTVLMVALVFSIFTVPLAMLVSLPGMALLPFDTDAIESAVWFWLMVLSYLGWVLWLVFKPNGTWHAYPRQAYAAGARRLTVELAAQRVVATETYQIDTHRNRTSSLPLSALRCVYRHVQADPGSDLSDSYNLYLELKPGASLGMAWADWQLALPLGELRYGESPEPVMQMLAERTGIELVR